MNLYLRKDGRYESRVPNGKKPDGKLIITDPKSESSRRQIPIPECMVSFLLKYKGKPNKYILTGTEQPIEPRAMQYRFQTILKNAKLPSVHFHGILREEPIRIPADDPVNHPSHYTAYRRR